ncbi:UNVERIFIED_CONTAM: SufE family protein [Methylobacteriaceae bacterium AG10]|nr:SufE family protein [Methylobacteriaceae bacterium AG10]
MLPDLDTIIENFELIDDPHEQLVYVMELGRSLPPMPEAWKSQQNLVRGCESQVWLVVSTDEDRGGLTIVGDSDSHLVKGFVALMVALYSGKSPEQAAKLDGLDLLKQLNFGAHVTSKRSNGVRAMVEKIQRDASRVS